MTQRLNRATAGDQEVSETDQSKFTSYQALKIFLTPSVKIIVSGKGKYHVEFKEAGIVSQLSNLGGLQYLEISLFCSFSWFSRN